MSRFPPDAEVERQVAGAGIEPMIAVLLSTTGPYQARRTLAELVVSLRGHLVTRDNVEVLPRGTEMKCDQCGMKASVPERPDAGQPGVFGRATELNCPASRKGRPAGVGDMPLSLYEALLLRTGAEALPGEAEELAKQDKERAEAVRRFEAVNEALMRKLRR